MNIVVFRFNLLGILLITSGILGYAQHAAFAQAPAPLPRAFEQNVSTPGARMSLDDILAAITKQTHVGFLVDDEPIIHQAELTIEGSLHDVLDKVCDTYDYTWRVSKAGVVLMSKRFKNPEERPQMNVPEMLEMARSVVRALTLVDYGRDEAQADEGMKRVVQTFTPDQTKALYSETKLRGSDLLPNQRAALQQGILTRSFLPSLKLWQETIPLLFNISHAAIQAKPRTPVPAAGVNASTHDYFYIYHDAAGALHSFEIQHMIYGDNNVEVRTP